jgi:transposase
MKQTMKKAAYRKPYDEEFKKQAVELVIHSGKSCEQVARELGCSGYSLHLWKKQCLAQAAPVQLDGQTMSASEMEREIRALRKQVHYLEQQRSVLKKALSILGEEPNPGMR